MKKLTSEQEYEATCAEMQKHFVNGVAPASAELDALMDSIQEYEQRHGLFVPEPGAVSAEEFEETLEQAALSSDDPRKRD